MKELKCEQWGIWVKGVQEFFVSKTFSAGLTLKKNAWEKKNRLPPLSTWQLSCLQCCSWYFSITILHFLITTPNILASNPKFYTKFHTCEGFSGDSVVKNPPEMQKTQRHRFSSWVGKIPWRRKWQSTPIFLPGKSHGQKSLIGFSPWGCNRVGHDWRLSKNDTCKPVFLPVHPTRSCPSSKSLTIGPLHSYSLAQQAL